MLLKVALALIFVSAATASVLDDNNIIDYALEGYLKILKNDTTSGPGLGCCPVIVLGPKGSIIQPFTGWRGNVALIVDYGTCTNQNHGFKCCVNWGDGSPLNCKYLDDFGPCQIAYQYPKQNAHYTVTAYYCSIGKSTDPCKPASCCRTYTRDIDTSYDPGKGPIL